MLAIDIAKDIAKLFEGFKSKPYLCPAGVPTIGYGSTMYENSKKVTLQDAVISKERAEELLMWELTRSMKSALRYCPCLFYNEKKLAAITDFVYNLGAGRLQQSTLRRKINQQDWNAAKKELLKWNKGGGKILLGLTKRRIVESKLFD